ncbi:MAG: MFS transporter [Actinophytocola sp.]|uniref:MFS transporter n=1 Tax=Actinophytocola sp. TaxID=1872138 RepID=UPI003D6C6D66
MVSLLLVGFADETVAFLPYGAVESIREDVGISYLQAGLLLAVYPGIGLLGTPLGVLVDYVSRRAMAVIGGIGYGVGLWLFAVAGNFATLFVAVVVMGLMGDALVRAVEVALVDVAGDKIEPALARSNLLASVGDLVGPLLLAGALATGLGWRGAFWIAGAMMVAYGVLLATQPLPRPTGADDEERRPWRTFLEVARDRRVLVAGLLVGLLVAFDETFVGFAVAFLTTDRGLSPAVATLAAGGGMAGGLAAAAWASRTNRRRIGLRPCAVLLLAGVVLLFVPNVVAAAVGTAAVGAAANLAWIILQAAYMTLRPGQAGTTSAVVDAVSNIGVLTPLAIGLVADHHGLTVAMVSYVLLALVFVVSTRRRGSADGAL